MPRRSPQLALELKPRHRWGGARPGAGRKPTGKGGVPHRARPAHSKSHPLHVTLRLVRRLGNARAKRPFRVIRDAFKKGRDRLGFRLVHFSVQSNHIHLIAEATDEVGLQRGLKGLLVRIARGLNKLWGRRGRIFADRYHARALKTPRETRNALAYVLLNSNHHSPQGGMRSGVDPCSSGSHFNAWKHGSGTPRDTRDDDDAPITSARTWLLTAGWKRHGLISIDEVPGA